MSGLPTERTADHLLEDLGLSLNPNVQWNTASMFPKVKGFGAKGTAKRKVKLIQNLGTMLEETLYPEEVVQYVAQGVQVKFSEQYFLGLWANLINQTVFVLTDVRILMYHTNTRGVPHNSIWMVYYSEIVKFQKRFGGSMTMKLKDGGKFVFTGFKGADRKNMPQIFQRIQQDHSELGFQPEVSQSRENLCLVCKDIVPKNIYHCQKCGQQFWTPSEIALRSLMFPSWGDWIMGHHILALVELLGYLLSWLVLIALVTSGDLAFAIPMALVVLVIEHAFDAALTFFIAKKRIDA